MYADTAQGYYHIPSSATQEKINSSFDLKQAKETAIEQLSKKGYPQENIEITNTQSFNLVRGFRTTGKILEVTAQVKPGLY